MLHSLVYFITYFGSAFNLKYCLDLKQKTPERSKQKQTKAWITPTKHG